jgi:hypothetical protein
MALLVLHPSGCFESTAILQCPYVVKPLLRPNIFSDLFTNPRFLKITAQRTSGLATFRRNCGQNVLMDLFLEGGGSRTRLGNNKLERTK